MHKKINQNLINELKIIINYKKLTLTNQIKTVITCSVKLSP
jgi:hypothetical protein